LLDIKNQQTQANNELQQGRMNLAQCSYMDDPSKWNMLFDTVQKLAIKLHDITNELIRLEIEFFKLNKSFC
jgi:N-formylglutamate amidohydrolase